MKKANRILAVLLAVLILVGLYFLLGARLKLDEATVAADGGMRCELTLTNSSLFPCQYLEFLVVKPENGTLKDVVGAGTDIGALSRATASFVVPDTMQKPCEVQIGYYVLGMRRTIDIRID